jgi:predicted RNase H-like nuclease
MAARGAQTLYFAFSHTLRVRRSGAGDTQAHSAVDAFLGVQPWMVSPRSSMAMKRMILRARASGVFSAPMR